MRMDLTVLSEGSQRGVMDMHCAIRICNYTCIKRMVCPLYNFKAKVHLIAIENCYRIPKISFYVYGFNIFRMAYLQP